MSWTDALVAGGVIVLSVDGEIVDLQHEKSRRRFHVVTRRRSLRPSEVEVPRGSARLLVAPQLSKATQSRLRELDWSWVTETGQVHLRFPKRDFDVDPKAKSEPALVATGPLGRRGLGAYALLRRLLTTPAGIRLHQDDLAASTSMSQPRVSQLLRVLTDADLVAKAEGSWTVPNWDKALDVWLTGYPGPGGTSTHWAGLDDMWTQTGHVLDVLPADAVVSGDAGADALAARAVPRRSVLYTRIQPNLAVTGLVPVTNAEEATVSVCVPRDTSVWPLERLERRIGVLDVAVADPLQVLWDLTRNDRSDADQAADQLRAWIENTYKHGSRR